MRGKILCAALAACAALSASSCREGGTRVIKVFGNGEVTYIPDKVTMTVRLKDVQPVLRDAVANTNAQSRGLLELCRRHSVPDEDVKTSFAQSGREYEWRNGREVFVGFRSEQSVQITLRDLGRMEEFTGEILALRVHSLGDLRYGHSRESEFEGEANLLALDDAKAAAEKMAGRMNVRVGDVLYISDVDAGEPPNARTADYRLVAQNKSLNSSSGLVVAPGILSATKNVVVAFEIRE